MAGHGRSSRGEAGLGKPWHGMVGHGKAGRFFGPIKLRNKEAKINPTWLGIAGHGWSWRGPPKHGKALPGMAMQCRAIFGSG